MTKTQNTPEQDRAINTKYREITSGERIEARRRFESIQAEIDRRISSGELPISHKHGGVRTHDDGGPNVEYGTATWPDGFDCEYRWYGDVRNGNVYVAR